MGSETMKFCEAASLLRNVSLLTNFSFLNLNSTGDFPFGLSNHTSESVPEKEVYESVQHYAYDVTLPIIFTFGIIGNILNIIIFSKSRFRHSLDEVEKSATTGECIFSSILYFSEKSAFPPKLKNKIEILVESILKDTENTRVRFI